MLSGTDKLQQFILTLETTLLFYGEIIATFNLPAYILISFAPDCLFLRNISQVRDVAYGPLVLISYFGFVLRAIQSFLSLMNNSVY